MKIVGNTVGTTTKPKALGDKLGLENKLDKITEANKVYGTDGNGEQTNYAVSPNVSVNTIVRRLSNGHISVPLTPNGDQIAASKGYVDQKQSEAISHTDAIVKPLEERVTDLESLTLTYIEDGSTAYEKSVPANVGSKALIKAIGGATQRVIGKNLINPATLEFNVASESGFWCEHTLNDDGTITYTVKSYACPVYINIDSEFPAGRYYAYIEGANSWYFDGVGIEIDCCSDFDETLNDGEGDYVETTRTLKVMLWRDEDAVVEDEFTWEVVEAPEGTVFEPYHEPYFEDAEVERIESLGKNRLPSNVMTVSNWVTTSNPVWANYNFDLSDGWYCISAKLKEGYANNVYLYVQKSVDGGITYTSTNAVYTDKGAIVTGYFITDAGFSWGNSLWFKVDKKAGILYRLTFNNITQKKLDQIYDMQIERVNLTKEPSASYPPSQYAPATAYAPYKAEPINTFVIPEAVRNKDGYGREGSFIEWVDDTVTLTVTKDENLEALATPEVTDITDLFTEGNKIEIVGRGVLRFVNKDKIPVPSSVWFTTRKE